MIYEVLVLFNKSDTKSGTSEMLWTACEAKDTVEARARASNKFPKASRIKITGAEFSSGHGDWPEFLRKKLTRFGTWVEV